jgi:hypothetical protein
MNANIITKRLRFGLSRLRILDRRFTGLASRQPTSEVRRNILKKLSLRLNKKLASSS